MNRLLITLFTSLSLLPTARAASADDTVTPLFIRNLGYFETLDYNRPKIAKKIPALEKSLVELLPRLREQTSTHAIDPQVAAMSMAYIAMYLVNTGYGLQNGKIDQDDLHAIEPSTRNPLVLSLLEEARALSPEQPMIAAWLEGERIRISGGAGVDQLIARTKTDPVFTLFSALILEQEFSFTQAQQDELFKQVLKMTSSESPCRDARAAKTPACGASPLVPYSRQAAGLYFGDAYLKKGSELLNDGEISNDGLGRHYAGMALILYGSLHKNPQTALATHEWSNETELNQRRKLADLVIWGKINARPYFKTQAAIRPYQCASCHSK